MYCLYCHTNKINGKRYFGITSNIPDKRWSNGNGYKSSRHFNYAIQKYGWDSFSHDIVAKGLTKEQACELEKEFISMYRTTEHEFGYNISLGGQSGAYGVVQSEETKKKKSQKLKGRIFTEEHREKLSKAAKGRVFTDEHKQKLRDAKKGTSLSEEHRRHISEANKGRKLSNETKEKIRESKRRAMRPVYCEETDTVYESVSEAARVLGVNSSNISATCRGKFKHVGGYHVRYYR